MAFTTRYSGCIVMLSAFGPELVWLCGKAVKPVPGATGTPLSSKPRAPISSSSGCEVVAVRPESAVMLPALVVPVPVWDLSFGDGDTRPSKEKKVTASFVGVGDGKLTVMVPPAKALVTGAEKTSVRTPLMPEPLATSASLV